MTSNDQISTKLEELNRKLDRLLSDSQYCLSEIQGIRASFGNVSFDVAAIKGRLERIESLLLQVLEK